MKAAIYNPYLDTLGGGERYTMAVAQLLVDQGYQVNVEWKNTAIKRKLESRFGINLTQVSFVKSINKGDSYDVCFWVSDGSIPLLRARKNLLHFQIPFTNVNGGSLLNKTKLFRIKNIVCNSVFTKRFIDEEYGVKSVVIYPPCDIKKIKPKRKKKIILSVGRFSQLTQAKRQDVLIKANKKLYDSGFSDWRLVLAGGVEVGIDDYLAKLKKLIKGYPVEIIESPDFVTIRELFGQAKFFWSASGYQVDEEKEPKKVEHFGISVVEAMTAKAIPLVYSAGGPKEIIKNAKNGYLWKSIAQLNKKTTNVICQKNVWQSVARKAQKDAKNYSYENFFNNFSKILE